MYTLVHLTCKAFFVCLPLCTQFFLIPGLRALKRLSPDLPLPLGTPLTATPGCWSTLSRVVFLIAAGEMRSWSARYCSSLWEEGKAPLETLCNCRCVRVIQLDFQVVCCKIRVSQCWWLMHWEKINCHFWISEHSSIKIPNVLSSHKVEVLCVLWF